MLKKSARAPEGRAEAPRNVRLKRRNRVNHPWPLEKRHAEANIWAVRSACDNRKG